MLSGLFGKTKFAVPRAAIASAGSAPLDIMLTLDLSGSMASNGRIQALQNAAPEFISVIERSGSDDCIGVMGYGAIPKNYDPVKQKHRGRLYLSTPRSLYPKDSDYVGILESGLTKNYKFLRHNVLEKKSLVSRKYGGSTPIGAALRDAAHYLNASARADTKRVIVLMSDGQANKPQRNARGYAQDMARYAAKMNIKVYTIALGSGADKSLMKSIAKATGGQFFEASGSNAQLSKKLSEAFRSVASALKRTQLVQ